MDQAESAECLREGLGGAFVHEFVCVCVFVRERERPAHWK